MARYGFEDYMSNYVNMEDDRIKEVVTILGSKTSLGEGLDICKALIFNYFEGDAKAKAIIKLIEESVEKRKTERRGENAA